LPRNIPQLDSLIIFRKIHLVKILSLDNPKICGIMKIQAIPTDGVTPSAPPCSPGGLRGSAPARG
jgi:hypothetical protein